MQELIKNFGINPYLLIAQIINFVIILYLLKRFAYKPILTLLDKRKAIIVEGYKQAEESRNALENALEKEKSILKNAQNESKKILIDANTQADTIVSKANDKGRQQVEKLVSDTRSQLERERKEIEKQLATKVTEIAADILQKSLEGFFDAKEQREVVGKAKKKLKL